MKKRVVRKLNNEGLTLMELLIALSIMAVILLAAMGFLASGTLSFARGSADANVQKDTQLLLNQIETNLLNMDGGVQSIDVETISEGGTEVVSKVTLTVYTGETELNVVTNPADEGTEIGAWSYGETEYFADVYVWERESKSIYLSRYNVTYNVADGFETGSAEYENQLLSNTVTGFNVTLNTHEGENKRGVAVKVIDSIVIDYTCEDASGSAHYSTQQTITPRNSMIFDSDPVNIFSLKK